MTPVLIVRLLLGLGEADEASLLCLAVLLRGSGC